MEPIQLYDTTLRDGTQGENISFSAEDKIEIAKRLDDIGIHFIEGGWPGSNPRDKRFFDLAKSMQFNTARLAAFGSTRRPGVAVADDANVKALLESETEVVTIFGKSWNLHVEQVMDNTLSENLTMISETVAYLMENGREVIYDAEHFFDGYREDSDYALQTLMAAIDGGARTLVLCDTNGGRLPFEIGEATETVIKAVNEKNASKDDNEKIEITHTPGSHHPADLPCPDRSNRWGGLKGYRDGSGPAGGLAKGLGE